MKLKYILASALCAAMTTANATGVIKVSTSAPKIAVGETVEVVVSMTNDPDEVRGLEFQFTLPDGLKYVENSKKYNSDRFDGFISNLDIRSYDAAGDKLSKVTFMSLSDDHVWGTEGDLFSFKVTADGNYKGGSFEIATEISYDDNKVDEDTKSVFANKLDATVSVASQAMTIESFDDEVEVKLAVDNNIAFASVQFDIDLPEGMEIVKNARGKVAWSYSDRVSSYKSASESTLANGNIRYVLIDAMSQPLVNAGSGEFVSFKVKATPALAVNGESIKLTGIIISDMYGVEKSYKDITISVYNKAEETRQADNQAAAEADYGKWEDLCAAVTQLIKGNEEAITPELREEIERLMSEEEIGEAIAENLQKVETEGVYQPVYDEDSYEKTLAYFTETIKAVVADYPRVQANIAAATADMDRLEDLQAKMSNTIKGYEEYLTPDDIDVVNDICGETWPMVIQGVLEGVELEGEYESPMNWEQLEANIAEVWANIVTAQAGEEMDKLEGYQAQITQLIIGNEKYTEGLSEALEPALNETFPLAISDEMENAIATGEAYESQIDDEYWQDMIAQLEEIINDAKQAEADLLAANEAAALADMERLEALQTKMSNTIKGYEEYLTPDDVDVVNDICGDTWPLVIQGALEGAEAEGVAYESPMNWAQLEANIAEVWANIVTAQAQEEMDKLEGYQAQITQLIIGNEKYTEGLSEALEPALNETFPLAISDEMENAIATGEAYESQIDDEYWQDMIAQLEEIINDAKQAEADLMAANEAAALADMERLEALQTQLSEIIRGNEEYLTPDDIDVVSDICGDTWLVVINGAMEGANEVGDEYESPVNWAQLAANIAEIKANIAAAKQAAQFQTLSDDMAYTNDLDLHVQDVTYTRNVENGNLQSIYLPFDMENGEWTESFDIYRINAFFDVDEDNDGNVDGTYLNVIKVKANETVRHNTPYVVKLKDGVEAGDKTIKVENTTIYAAENASIDCSSVSKKYEFTGLYARTVISELTSLPFYAVNKSGLLQKGSNKASVPAFHWYMTVEDRFNSGVANAPSIKIVLSDDEATAINDVKAAMAGDNTNVYNLNGVKVSDTNRPGLYIKNGKKVVVK